MATKKIKLTSEEQKILDSYDADEWQPVENRDAEMSKYRQIARTKVKKGQSLKNRSTKKKNEA